MRKLFLIFAGLIIVASCSTLKVTNHWDRDVDFKSFKTFSFYPWDKHNDEIVNEWDKKTILESIKEEMTRRGYKYVEEGGDLVVSVFVIIENKTSYQAYTNHYGYYGGGWGYYSPGWAYGYGWGPGYSSTTIHKVDYKEGTLIIDIFDSKTKNLIWQGIGVGEVKKNSDNRDARLSRAISHIFRRYPITKKKG